MDDLDPKTPPNPPPADAGRDDTEAILRRRAFLIRSALAGTGLALLGADCRSAGTPERPGGGPVAAGGTEPPDPFPGVDAGSAPPDAGPLPCLSPPYRPPIEPRVCLSVMPVPPREEGGPEGAPRICLSDDTIPGETPPPPGSPRPLVCLDVPAPEPPPPPRDVREPGPEPNPLVCLEPPEEPQVEPLMCLKVGVDELEPAPPRRSAKRAARAKDGPATPEPRVCLFLAPER